jgi:hypothetical protein
MSSEGYSSATLSTAEFERLERERQEARQTELRRLAEEQRLAEQRRQVEEVSAIISLTDQFEEQMMRIRGALSAQPSAPSPVKKESTSDVEEQIRSSCDDLAKALAQFPLGTSPELDVAIQTATAKIAFLRTQGGRQLAMAAAAFDAIKLEIDYAARRFGEYLRRQTEEIRHLLVEVKFLGQQAIEQSDADQAASLESEVLALLLTPPSPSITQRLAKVKHQITDLGGEIERLSRNAAERKRVLSIVEMTLVGMGYEVKDFAPEDPLVECRAALSGNGDRVEFEFGLDRNLHFAFDPADDLGTSEAVERCRQWCGQYERLVQQLRLKGVEMSDHWRKRPEELPPAAEQRQNKEVRRRKREPKRRSL